MKRKPRGFSPFRLVSFFYCTTLIVLFGCISLAKAQLNEIEIQLPKSAPLKVETKNHDSEEWVRDLEIIVTNTGEKPIYFLFLSLTLDVKADDGNVRGFPFLFGNGDLYSTNAAARSGDPFIAPNDIYIFRIKENLVQGWSLRKARGSFEEPKRGFLRLGWLNFGDGSGMKGGGSPFKKKTR